MRNIIYKGIIILVLFTHNTFYTNAQESPRSYYVRATGDDQNNGRTEKSPFKTIKRALEVATQGEINRITVIGILNQISEKCNSNQDVFILSNEGENEIIICGKETATQQERAVLSAAGTKKRCVAIKGSGKIRFEDIEISGANTTINGAGILGPYNSPITLGNKTKIIGNITSARGGGIYASGKWTIEEGAVIKGNKANIGGGVYVPYSWSVFNMKGGIITNNSTVKSGGGICIADGSNNFIMESGIISNNFAGTNGGGVYTADKFNLLNGSIINNIAKKNGGGLYMGWDADVSYSSSEGPNVKIKNCKISGNNAEFGAGIYDNIGKLDLAGGDISNNKAEFVGGGVYIGEKGLFNQTGGEIAKNVAGDGTGQDVYEK